MFEREESGSVLVLRLAHGKANAFDLEFCEALEKEFSELAQHPARSVLLTGTGKIFSAGVDLFRVLREGREYIERFLPAFERAMHTLVGFPKPLVGAINGHAIAGGCVLACTCDWRILGTGRAKMGVPELKVGVPFPSIALEIMRFALNPAHLNEIVCRGASVGPERALEVGLVDELCEAEGLFQRGLDVAQELAGIPRRSFSMNKAMLRGPLLERAERDGKALAQETIDSWSSPEVRETMKAFVEKTIGK